MECSGVAQGQQLHVCLEIHYLFSNMLGERVENDEIWEAFCTVYCLRRNQKHCYATENITVHTTTKNEYTVIVNNIVCRI